MQAEPTAVLPFLAEQAERLFLGFLEAAPDAVVIIDGRGVILEMLTRVLELFTRADPVGANGAGLGIGLDAEAHPSDPGERALLC